MRILDTNRTIHPVLSKGALVLLILTAVFVMPSVQADNPEINLPSVTLAQTSNESNTVPSDVNQEMQFLSKTLSLHQFPKHSITRFSSLPTSDWKYVALRIEGGELGLRDLQTGDDTALTDDADPEKFPEGIQSWFY